MTIDLTLLKEKNLLFEYFLPNESIDLTGEPAHLDGAVKIKGTLTKGFAQTNVEGEIFARVELECTRCLQPVNRLLEISFAAAFVAPEYYTEAKEVQLGAEDLDVSILGSDKIDLTEIAREQILLALPERIYCREDCKGLCGQCALNRNLIDCNCEEKEVDPRWQGLRELKIKE